jgi:hypothetical protein
MLQKNKSYTLYCPTRRAVQISKEKKEGSASIF